MYHNSGSNKSNKNKLANDLKTKKQLFFYVQILKTFLISLNKKFTQNKMYVHVSRVVIATWSSVWFQPSGQAGRDGGTAGRAAGQIV